MKTLITLALLATCALGRAQQVQQLEYVEPHRVKVETLQLSCDRADVGRGVGKCKEHTIIQVFNAPRNLTGVQYECSVTWELEKDGGQVDFVDITSKVELRLYNGNGRASFETIRYVGSASDPVSRIRRSTTRCIPTSY